VWLWKLVPNSGQPCGEIIQVSHMQGWQACVARNMLWVWWWKLVRNSGQLCGEIIQVSLLLASKRALAADVL
jgi:hypothetical protein